QVGTLRMKDAPGQRYRDQAVFLSHTTRAPFHERRVVAEGINDDRDLAATRLKKPDKRPRLEEREAEGVRGEERMFPSPRRDDFFRRDNRELSSARSFVRYRSH